MAESEKKCRRVPYEFGRLSSELIEIGLVDIHLFQSTTVCVCVCVCV